MSGSHTTTATIVTQTQMADLNGRENFSTPAAAEVKANGEVWVRGDVGFVFTGLTLSLFPLLAKGTWMNCSLEVLRALGLALRAANKELGRVK